MIGFINLLFSQTTDAALTGSAEKNELVATVSS